MAVHRLTIFYDTDHEAAAVFVAQRLRGAYPDVDIVATYKPGSHALHVHGTRRPAPDTVDELEEAVDRIRQVTRTAALLVGEHAAINPPPEFQP